MKRRMNKWRVMCIVLGMLVLLGAVAGLMTGSEYAAIVQAISAMGLFMMASVCAWMDDLLEAVSQNRPAAQMRRRRPARQTEEAEDEAPDTITQHYRRARDSE